MINWWSKLVSNEKRYSDINVTDTYLIDFVENPDNKLVVETCFEGKRYSDTNVTNTGTYLIDDGEKPVKKTCF